MIKWFDSRLMAGIPELTNTRGDLVKMLNGLLVNGANLKPVTSITYADGVCTLDVGVNHGFVVSSVIDIQGSTQTTIVGQEFRVKDVTISTVSFNAPTLINNETGLTVRYAPLGWTQHFASEGKSCYKSTDIRYPAYLRVDDTKYTTKSATGAKFAGVEICADMTDFDTAAWQSPYDTARPFRNRGAGDSTGWGWFKWVYASANSVNSGDISSPNGVRNYVLIGDKTSFLIVFYPYVDSDLGCVVGMPLLDFGIEKKQALVAWSNNNTNVAPHEDFLSKGLNTDALIAPYYTARGNAESYVFNSINSSDDILLQTPVFLLSSAKKLNANVDGIALVPSSNPTSGILTSGNSLKKIANTGKAGYSVIFDVGSY